MRRRACDHCGQLEGEGVQLKRCGQCRQALFCSRSCLRAAWPVHKEVCARVVVHGAEGLALPDHCFPDAVVPDAPEPGPGEWRFGRQMRQPQLALPFPLTRESFQACLPQLLAFVEYFYNVVLTRGGRVSAENSPAHAIFLTSVRKGQPVPGRADGEVAGKDETRMAVCALPQRGQLGSGREKERSANEAMQNGIDMHRAQAALFMQEQRARTNDGDMFRVCFGGVAVAAMCPGVRRCFQLDMLPGGRRDGRLVRAEPAVETRADCVLVFLSKHPRFYPAP